MSPINNKVKFMKKIILLTLLLNILGCQQSDQKIEKNDRYVSQPLNTECESFLKNNITYYLVCDSWKIKSSDLNDILKFSKKYQVNFISSQHLMMPLETDQKRFIVKDNIAYVLYPNGFFVVAEKGKYDNESGYSEENQSYVCLRAECEKYFLWKFVDENIIANNPNFEEENPRPYDIAKSLEEKHINAQPEFVFKGNEIDINGKACHYRELATDQPKECLYYIADDTLYVYDIAYTDEKSMVQKIKLK